MNLPITHELVAEVSEVPSRLVVAWRLYLRYGWISGSWRECWEQAGTFRAYALWCVFSARLPAETKSPSVP